MLTLMTIAAGWGAIRGVYIWLFDPRQDYLLLPSSSPLPALEVALIAPQGRISDED
jgi:hypothetical protein